MFFLGVCLFGILSIREIPLSLLPNIELPQLTIVTSFANSSPEEVENIISKPISQLVGTIQGVEKVETNSKEGYSFVHLRFKNRTDMTYALLEVREKLDLIRDVLPADASKPLISKFDPSKRAFMEIVFSPKGLGDRKNRRTFINDFVKLYFERIDGVALVELSGGFEKEFFVEIDPELMYAYKIQPNDLRYLITSNNKNYPAGQLPFGNKDLPVRMIGEFTSSSQLENLVIKGGNTGAVTRLKDFANVLERYRERKGYAKYNGEEAVILSLYREPGKNIVQLSENVSHVINQINSVFFTETKGVISYDESIFIKASLNGLYFNLILGASLAYLALLIILKNYQSPTILLFAIPITLFPTFLLFNFLGIGFNMMSLGGLALGIGMLFDSSNVVLSAIERNLTSFVILEDAIYSGTMEVFNSVFSATATTMIVFLPIGFIESTLGMIFREMAFSIVITLFFGLITAITFIPLIASYLYKWRNERKRIHFLFRIYNEEKLIQLYQKFLLLLLRRKTLFYILLLSLFVFSLSLIPLLEKEFLPRIDTGEITIRVQLPQGTDLESMAHFIDYMESTLLKDKIIRSLISYVGGDDEKLRLNPNAINESNKAELRLLLNDDRHLTTQEYIEILRGKFPRKDNIQLNFETKDNILGELLSDKKDEIIYYVLGDDPSATQRFGKSLKSNLETLIGVKSISIGSETRSSEYQLTYDQIKMAHYGLTNANVSNFVKIALKGIVCSEIQSGGLALNIRVGMKKNAVDSIEKIRNLTIVSPNGENVSLNQFINISKQQTESDIIRIGNQRVNPILIELETNKGDMKKEVESIIKNFPIPKNIRIKESGEKEKMNESFEEVILSFLLAILLIFMLLSGQFESYLTSTVMLVTIPIVFIGTFPALLFTNKSLNISSFMGFILLMGVVVDNAALYYEYFHLFLKESNDLEVALIRASSTVLRPILMNNATTILGMLPIVLALSKGSEFQAPLGVVVVFGLLTSVVITLFLIPILFYSLELRGLGKNVF